MLSVRSNNQPSGQLTVGMLARKHWCSVFTTPFIVVINLQFTLTRTNISLLWENSKCTGKKKSNLPTWRDGGQAECIRVSVGCYRLIRGWIIHVSTWNNSKDKDSLAPLHLFSPAFLKSASKYNKSYVLMSDLLYLTYFYFIWNTSFDWGAIQKNCNIIL